MKNKHIRPAQTGQLVVAPEAAIESVYEGVAGDVIAEV